MKAPYGYRSSAGRLIPDPAEAPVRRRMFELFVDLGRLKTVARHLNEAGHRTRGGGTFSDTTVARLIKDPTARGVHPTGPVEAIVSEELWQACNRLLKDRKGSGTTVNRRVIHLYSGLAFCACGRQFLARGRPPRYSCTVCSLKVTEEDLGSVFEAALATSGQSRVLTAWAVLDPEARRRLVEATVYRIVVGPGEVEVTFYDLAEFSGNEGATDDSLPSCSGLRKT